jgi:potassium efflux system protein
VLLYAAPTPAYRESLARLAFVIVMFIFSGVVHAMLHPHKGVASPFYSAYPSSWVSRLRWLWYALGAGSPILLSLVALVGYLYTAATLTGRVIDTFWLILVIIVVNLVVTRWFALPKRKIAWQLAIEEHEARQAAESSEAGGADGEAPPVIETKPLDLDAVDQQSTRLLNAGLFFVGALAAWGIWSEVVPALGVLDQVSLWSQTSMVDGEETIVPVTLADLLFAVFVAGVTAIASTNLPGLMEIAVLQRLTLQPGSRYAINTLTRYVVVTVGVIAVLNIVGWKWSQIQWLVAALSVGLGFGLQEIVANFVSGLVILFERPVRVGDTVTVGQLTGTVSRVRIRATTITDWDRKEIIVPNKSFITEQVINWTLSDPITRVVITVGVSYGSDVQLAHRVMEETLNSMPLVLDDPPPKVYFVGFGESSLDFRLNVYSRELADRLPLTHAVHEKILGALRKNGIEIPFPQRDLHLKSVDDKIAALKRDGDETDDQEG